MAQSFRSSGVTVFIEALPDVDHDHLYDWYKSCLSRFWRSRLGPNALPRFAGRYEPERWSGETVILFRRGDYGSDEAMLADIGEHHAAGRTVGVPAVWMLRRDITATQALGEEP